MPPAASPRSRAWPAVIVATLASVAAALITWWALDRGLLGDRRFEPAAAATIAAWALAIAVASLRGHVGARVVLGALGLAAVPIQWIAERLGWDPGPLGGARGPAALIIALVCLLTLTGLVRRRLWAFWLACAGAVLGVASGALNLLGSLAAPGLLTWSTTVTIAFASAALAGLLAADVRRAFHEDDRAALWRARDPLIVALRWMILADLVATPTLLIYAWAQPVVPETATPAAVLAFILGLGAILTVARKVIGALLLSLSGVGLVALAAWNVHATLEAPALAIVGYYAIFWVPAGLLSLVAGARLLARLRAAS
ncbi:MAG: hypothetical protein R3A51_21425 [Nannocystaceae bacterium]